MDSTKLWLICAPFLAAALLCGCSTPEGQFPSLARRPFEQNAIVTAPAVPPTPIASDLPEATRIQLSAIQRQHAAAAKAFAALLPAARSAAQAAVSAMIGSEPWVHAELMLSRLDKSRSDSIATLAQIDDLIIAQSDSDSKGIGPSMGPLLQPVQAEIASDIEQQNQEISRLSDIIGR